MYREWSCGQTLRHFNSPGVEKVPASTIRKTSVLSLLPAYGIRYPDTSGWRGIFPGSMGYTSVPGQFPRRRRGWEKARGASAV
jgi:hypothetical protein